jgi:4-hydroxyacetophenone monooxygenase
VAHLQWPFGEIKLGHDGIKATKDSIGELFTTNVAQVVLPGGELRAHLQSANAVHMLLSLVHVTGDVSLLDKYSDKVGGPPMPLRRGVYEEPASEEVRRELINGLVNALTKPAQAPYLGVQDVTVFAKMADLAAGTHVDAKYLPMYAEQAGFVSEQRAVAATKAPPATLNVAIIGAGMSGLDAAIKAANRGFTFEVFDREPGVGGLWGSQSYPGVGVDTPSMYYSLSYEVEPNWSSYYPNGDEYLAYLQKLAQKYKVTDHVRLNTEISRIEWDDDAKVWELTAVSKIDQSTRIVRAAVVITAAGHFNRPKYPEVEGREAFAGVSVHSAKWDNSLDLRGKKVGIVGAGAAAVQIIAAIAPEVSHLTVFQRQPHWIMPNMVGDGLVGENERWLRRHLPYYLQWARFITFWMIGDETGYPLVRVDEEWMKDNTTSISPYNEGVRQYCLGYINQCFGEGTALAKKLTPDFAMAGKRPIRDPADFGPGGYYYALSQPHVDIVTSGLARVTPESIVTEDGTDTALDVIIYASGMTLDWLSTMDVVGRNGQLLSEVWANNNPRSYFGGAVPGFPNLFVTSGPNTGVGHAGGHNFMAETQNRYIFECLQMLVEQNARTIEVTQDAHDSHNERLDGVMEGSIWAHELKAHNYYRNDAGRVILPSPWRLVEFWDMSQIPDAAKFVISQ